MELGNLGGVFDSVTIPTLQKQDFTAIILGFPSDPFMNLIAVNRKQYCMLSTMYTANASIYPHRRTRVNIDGNLLETTGSKALPSVSYQIYPPLRGINPSDEEFYASSSHFGGRDIVKHNPNGNIWQKVFEIPDPLHGAGGGGIVTINDKTYYFGNLDNSNGNFVSIVVESIDLNAGTMTRLATHASTGFSNAYLVGLGTDHDDIIYIAISNSYTASSPLQIWRYTISTNSITLVSTIPSNSEIIYNRGGALHVCSNNELIYVPIRMNTVVKDGRPVKIRLGESNLEILMNVGLFWDEPATLNLLPNGIMAYRNGDPTPKMLRFNY